MIMALLESLSLLFSRDLRKVADEIQAYHKDERLWHTDGRISNAAGNLALHICGNLQHFIGALLGNSGYVREREHEFNDQNISKEKLLEKIWNTEETVIDILQQLTEDQLAADYPIGVAGRKWKTEALLLHLLAHLNYHLGQINYHRRLVDK